MRSKNGKWQCISNCVCLHYFRSQSKLLHAKLSLDGPTVILGLTQRTHSELCRTVTIKLSKLVRPPASPTNMANLECKPKCKTNSIFAQKLFSTTALSKMNDKQYYLQ